MTQDAASFDMLGGAFAEALARPAGEALGLPAHFYRQPDVFAQERELVFAPSWVPIAFASDVANVGDAHPVRVAGWDLLVVRSTDGINVFHNICRHRGMRLVSEPANRNAIVCSYHCWTYDLNGRLKATPNIGGPGVPSQPGMETDDLGLIPVRAGVWLDLVFVNISGSAPPLEEHLAPVASRLARYDLGLLRPSRQGRRDLEIKANWKIYIEAGIEDYHLPFVHKETLGGYAKNYRPEHVGDVYAGFSQAHSLVEATRRHARDRPDGYVDLPPHPVVLKDDRAEFIAMFLLPLGVVTLAPNSVTFGLILPDAPDRTRTRSRSMFVGEAASDEIYAPARKARGDFFAAVVGEDIAVMEAIQEMSETRQALGLPTRFSGYWEKSLHAFQNYYARRMSGPPRA